jgi:hypothetical protein
MSQTVSNLRRKLENHLGSEIRLTNLFSTVAWTLQKIRAFGDARSGWSFDFAKSAFNTQAPYTTGTISVTQSSTSVTGSGTTWTGITLDRHKILLDGVAYPISSITNNTALVLTTAYAGSTLSADTYSIIKDEYTLTGATLVRQVIGMWDAANKRRIEGMPFGRIGDLEMLQRSTNSPRQYAIFGRGTSNAPIVQLQPYPDSIMRIEYWATYNYTKPTDPGDTISVFPDHFDELVEVGVLARTKQILRMDEWRDEMAEFNQMLVEAWFQDKTQRENTIRMMRNDMIGWSLVDLPGWHEVTT